MKPDAIERFYLLDILRAVAAYAVVLMHFRYFYLPPDGSWTPDFDISAQPFYWLLQPVYDHGATSVQIFFCMSGFIFFWLYRDSVADGRTGGYQFFVLRVSRLYPLHLVTLLIVAALQWSYHGNSGGFTAFGPNTAEQFVFQLFLATEWGLSGPTSFNGPIWTVSGEVFSYAVFFFLAAAGKAGWRGVIIAMLLAGLLQEANHRLGQAVFFFFAGGAIYLFWRELVQRLTRYQIQTTILPLSLMALVAGILAVDRLEGVVEQLVLWFVIAPLAVFIPVLLQSCWPMLGRSAAWFGDLTYAVYLIHFPLQLMILMTAWQLGYTVNPSPTLFLAYFGGLTVIAWFVFHRFELPMQRYLRRRLQRTPTASPGPAKLPVPSIAPTRG